VAKDEKIASEVATGGTTSAEKTPWQLQNEIDKLEQQIESLRAQNALPLTGLEIMQLRTVLADKKEKLGDHDAVIAGIELIAKLDAYLNPELPFNAGDGTSSVSMPLDGVTAQ